MELWIRSQDRERLTKVNDIEMYYAKSDDLYVIEDCDDLGAYKTKERALEILDEIQSILCFKRLESYSGEGIINIENNTALYLMPKE